ncbi:NAD-dependent succinate-semialdehyde dehydrogenase [Streptomyces sp. NPDC090075]|uniref:NAD-dependent succinate-semialdehyde dehydrogenase n=1 Tax=Streptomyces sp. NPDC090075 TaxID=3365937 RepID=UPI0037F9B42E
MATAEPTAFQTVNPATGEAGTTRARLTGTELEAVLDAVTASHTTWATTPLARRCEILRRVAELYRDRRELLAGLVVTEVGKPVTQALGEVDLCADIYDYYADNAPALLADREIPVLSGGGRALLRKNPLGTLLGIMPWNFPYYQIARFAAPNLAAGNCLLLKPAPQCPDSAAAVEALFIEAGLPTHTYATVFAGHDQIESLIAHPGVRGVSFTGSSRGGSAVAELAGRRLKKVVLELGGSDPFLVLDVGDLSPVVFAGVAARLENNGQSCNAAKRFIVLDHLYEEFLAKLTTAMAAITPGDPRLYSTQLGPLSSLAAAHRLQEQIAVAVHDGATLHLGGPRDGSFIPPTVLTDITTHNRAHHEEFFGPVALVYRARDEEHALSLANDTPFGLGSYIFTDDPDQARRTADRLDAGMVFVNGVGLEGPELPFGGTKNSGFGRELGPLGIDEFVNVKVIRIAAAPAVPTARNA